jgi:1-deoxy-D-xylulose-5-phosphate reductoisomerase
VNPPSPDHSVVVLGATGSIGRQAIEVAVRLGMQVVGLAARRPSPDFGQLALDHPEAFLAVAGGSADERHGLQSMVGDDRLQFGNQAVIDMAAHAGVVVVNGIVGVSGLPATIAGLEAGNRVALANKESLVAAGPLIRRLLDSGKGELIPVDSEHSALFQCLQGEHPDEVSRLLLTASGGPFRGWSAEALEEVTPQQALRHPTWSMGRRITVDSATLMNKGLEVIEANVLFGLSFDRIEVVVHPQSVVHSVVEFIDGSFKAHLGTTDMRIPIQYALTYPQRRSNPAAVFTLAGRQLDFEQPDRVAFPALDLAYQAGRTGRSAPAVLNAADEVAVEAFLSGRLGFTGIYEVISRTLAAAEIIELDNLDLVMEADREARQLAASLVAGVC